MKYLFPLAIVLLSAFLVGGYFFLPKYLPISKIDCFSSGVPCNPEIQSALQSFNGKSLQEVKTKIAGLVTDNPGITQYSLRYTLPNYLTMDILEKKAVYAVQPVDQNLFFDFDKQGVLIKIDKENNLPFLITSSKLPNVGETLDGRLLFALQIVDSIYYSYQVVDARVENNCLSVILPAGITVIFPLEGNQKALLGGFKLIFERVKANSIPDLQKITSIDLRFKNPVLK